MNKIVEDPGGWGRFMTTEFQGGRARKLWVVQVYAPCAPSGNEAEGYWNLILHHMQELKESGEDMQTDEEGKLCPKAQLIRDLSELRDLADDRKAEIIISGDFNESWKSKGPFRKWVEEESRLTNILQEREGTGGDQTCYSAPHDSWSDIDWVLASDGLLGEGTVLTAVSRQRDGAHCPIFITVDSEKGLGIGKQEVMKGADKDFEKNLLGGKESDPKIVLYKARVTAEWKKAKVRELIEEARKLSGKKKKR